MLTLVGDTPRVRFRVLRDTRPGHRDRGVYLVVQVERELYRDAHVRLRGRGTLEWCAAEAERLEAGEVARRRRLGLPLREESTPERPSEAKRAAAKHSHAPVRTSTRVRRTG